MKISIITIGDEILTGDILNLNSKYLCEEFTKLGHEIEQVVSVGDKKHAIIENVNNVIRGCNTLIITGGLGPTVDDLTIESVAEALNRELVFDEDILNGIKKRFAKFNRTMTVNNEKQAYRVAGSEVIVNNFGTASGTKIKEDGKLIYIFPGPPTELKAMFESVKNEFETDEVIKSIRFRCIGIGESSLETQIIDVIDTNEVEYGIYANKQLVDVKLTLKANNESVADEILSKYNQLVSNKIAEHIYSNGESLVEVIINYLRNNNETIALAESCTGGMLASMFVDISGASDVFSEGIVCYTNESKISRLGVSEKTLNEFTAVSSEVALEMSNGVCQNLKTNLGVGITGYAGGDDSGLVYISVCYNAQHQVKKFKIEGDRSRVRYLACLNALEMIYNIIK